MGRSFQNGVKKAIAFLQPLFCVKLNYSIVKLIGKRTRVRTFPFGISPGIHAGKERINLAASRSKEAQTPRSMITFETEPSFSTTKET